METTALLLLVTIPSMGWAQMGPMFPQSDAPVAHSLVPVEKPAAVVTEAPAEPIYKRWYFWTGVAGLTVGIIAASVGIAMATSRPATPLGEGPICSGKCDACIGFNCSGN